MTPKGTTPLHGKKIKPHNAPIASMDGLARKDALQAPLMGNAQKGIMSQKLTRGTPISAPAHVPTEFGNKPRPHK